jgi:hypothetical protein
VIDAHALDVPAAAQGSIKELAAYLIGPARNDFEKARAIFRWIAQNVSYDARGFFSKQYGDQSPEGVLRNGNAVCEGYSALFQALGQAAGLGVATIDGWAKGYSYEVKELDGQTNHAWNAIKVDGGWYLVDSTWGTGYLNKTGDFVMEFEPYYWLTPPDQFILNHLPSDSRWQLLPMPLSKAGFVAAPWVYPEFFSYGLQLPPGTEAQTRVPSQTTLLVSAPPDVLVTAVVEQGGRRLDNMWVFAQREGSQYEVEAVFPGPGQYDFVIFAKRSDEVGDYNGVVRLGYEVSQGQPTFAGFPQAFGAFGESGAYVYTPKHGGLAVGAAVIFKLSVPGAKDVAVIMGDMWVKLQNRGGGIWEGTVTIVETPARVYASFDGSGMYDGLLEYS